MNPDRRVYTLENGGNLIDRDGAISLICGLRWANGHPDDLNWSID